MKKIELNVNLRKEVGKSSTKKLRKEGMVPCVIYGGEENIHFYAPENEFLHLVYTPNVYLVNINVDGVSKLCYMKNIQFHAISDKIEHIDFIEVVAGKSIKIGLPVKFVGTSPGVLAGGKLRRNMRKMKVQALAENLPDFVEVDISKLNIGQTIKIKSLSFENLEILDNPSSVVVMVKSARGAAAELGEEEESAEGEEGGEASEESAEENKE